MSQSEEKRASFVGGNSLSPEELHSQYGIPPEEIDAFRDLIRVYSNQDVIIAEAEKDKAMYVLRFGTVKVFRRSGAQQKIMGIMDAVSIFGEMSALNDEPRSATVIAMTDKVLVYRIESPTIHEITANPVWAELLISQLAKTLARSIEQHIAVWQKVKELQAEVERLAARKA